MKDVSLVAMGTIISQGILFLVSPILTRLYSPEDFGHYAIFFSVCAMVGVLVTGKFEHAIVLPKRDEDAANVLALGVYLSMISFVVSALLIGLFTFFFEELEIVQDTFWLYFIPFNIALAGFYSCLTYWLQRKKEYIKFSIVLISQAFFVSVLNLTFGSLGYDYKGMIFSYTITQAIVVCSAMTRVSASQADKFFINSINFQQMKVMLKRYIDFPKYFIWSQLSLSISQQILPIIFAVIYTNAVVGFFTLSNRVLKTPVLVLANSISHVFRNEALTLFNEHGDCRPLYRSTFKKLFAIGIVPFTILSFASPYLFPIVFGEQWVTAGVYAQIMSVALFFDFIAMPFQTVYIVAEKQKLNLITQVLSNALGIGGIFVGYYVFDNAIYSILFFSIASVFMNLVNLYFTYKFAKKVN